VRILVVEDEQKLAGAVKSGLETEDCVVSLAHTGEDGFYMVQTQTFDLIVLDVMLPGRDGFEILSALRQLGVKTPVLLLTAKDAVEDRVRGLDAGADDYLVKPFAFAELQARIRALMRRGIADSLKKLKTADLEIELSRHEVSRGGTKLDLTIREYELLEYLMRNAGRVMSREMLARDVWKEASRHTPLDNVIDVQIGRLRRKVDDPFELKLVHTVRGVGFVVSEKQP
jgi:two-component system, OmpR family, copper resistance phosphate regulon response regulator CusR